MLKFNLVVARYGAKVLGGAEKHARDVAERLAARGHDVRVHTTCSLRYETWSNDLVPGTEPASGVEVVRHRTRVRRLSPFDEMLKIASRAVPRSAAIARGWAYAQGPVTPDLTAAVTREADARDLTVFFSLLSLPTYTGLAQIGTRSALVPLVHEEAPIYTSLSRSTLRAPRALMLNTEEEARRVARVAGTPSPPMGVVAVGRERPPTPSRDTALPTKSPYLVILGRLAKTKPFLPLWREISTRTDLPPLEVSGNLVPWRDVRLVTVGQLSPLYDRVPNVVALGFVSDQERWDILRNAVALVNPSVYESLSLVLLEAWSCNVPVLVNRACDVTLGQCTRSGGGVALDFEHPAQAALELAGALRGDVERKQMGERGRRYVETRYEWDRVLTAYERVASAVRDRTSVAEALSDYQPKESP